MIRRTYAISHVAFEDLGLWDSKLRENGGSVRYLQAGVDDLSSCIDDVPELVVVLGGPIGVYERDQYPFINSELDVIRHRLERQLPILGICLGAQLMAAALGARVYAAGVKEIGWGPISLTAAGRESCLRHLMESDYSVLHWHGDTFELPKGAQLLASTTAVENQAFSFGRHALALQFHVEVDPQKLETWLIGHTCELGRARIRPSELRAAAVRVPKSLPTNSARVLQTWLEQLG